MPLLDMNTFSLIKSFLEMNLSKRVHFSINKSAGTSKERVMKR